MLTKDWDFDIEEREAEFKEDLRAASGIGHKRRKVSKHSCDKAFFDITTTQKGRTTGPILSQQVKALIGDGNQAYVDNDPAEAMRIMQEVIRIEPRASAAWSVLAQCYEDMNESQKALQLRIMAAHLRHDAEEWDRLARESKYETFWRQNILCSADILFILGNMATTNKRCIVIEKFTVWIHPMLTRYGIEHLLPKRLEIFEPSVHLCAEYKLLSSDIS